MRVVLGAAVVLTLGVLFIGALNKASMANCLRHTSFDTCHKALN